MASIDVFTCYTLAGAGSLFGLGLISLVRVESPRVRRALWLYRLAFLCLAGFLWVGTLPVAQREQGMHAMIGVAAIGASLLAWGFRQLNGQRTPPALGVALTLGLGGLLWWAGAATSDATFAVLEAAVMSFIALGTLIDQGVLLRRATVRRGGEFALLLVAGLFSLDWVLILWHTLHWVGPYPDHLLFAPDWLLPASAVGVGLLPLSVASVVFAIVNDRLNQQLRERALRDDLTGTLSRRGLREHGERMLAGHQPAHLAMRQDSGVAALMLDVDHFKAINDRHGHLVGDEVLRHLSAVMTEHLRDDALLARYGGEEFTVLLPVRSRQDAETVAERLRQAIEAQPCESRAGRIRVTVSIGVAFHQTAHSLDEVLSRADTRLYEAKQAGRNRVICEPLAA
ncbi:GGDEF domain-containing protein [Aquabacterium sp.]|uniref:GGDEF domain-containing protein n=1 Tax=Aquabacterium sp. TaxID=1872578 RepID=UPI00248A129B|nr:GGDEF domain-containing protein [Aquabacterium sp.]MDI1349406.1 GGDEF domain-containing protein [Aquabacterium sp.]